MENVYTTFSLKLICVREEKYDVALHQYCKWGNFVTSSKVAKSIPFSSDKLLDILNHFSVKEKSVEAKVIKSTIDMCETPGTAEKSLVDFSISKLGKNVQVLSTQVPKETKKKEYRITRINVNKG